jgi:hypothetical protein
MTLTTVRPHLSASQLQSYLKCGVAWERSYIRGERSPATGPMIRGSALDEAATVHYRNRGNLGGGLSSRDFVEVAVATHDRLLPDVVLDVEPEASRVMVRMAASAYHRDIANKLVPRSFEDVQRRFEAELDGFSVVGIVDLITDTGAVVDTKLKSRMPSAGDLDSDIQLSVYSWLTGASNLALAVATPTGKTALLWTQRDAADAERIKLLFSRVFAALQLGVVVPAAPGSWNCSEKWCAFWPSCEFGGK